MDPLLKLQSVRNPKYVDNQRGITLFEFGMEVPETHFLILKYGLPLNNF
jgi:hypothetical protein